MTNEIENYACIEVKTTSYGRLEENYEHITNFFKCLGIEELDLNENDLEDIPEYEKLCGQEPSEELIKHVEKQVGKGSSIKFYFDQKNSQLIDDFCQWLKNENLAGNITKQYFKNQDWQKLSNESFQVIHLKNGVSIFPVWDQETKNQAKYPIIINPAMAFGTGSHETTALCLEAFYNRFIDKKFFRVFDFGCGSGILAIGAKVLNPDAYVHCYDIDQRAVENTIENFELNKIREKFDINHKLIVEKQKYDVIFANILFNILLDEYMNIDQRLNSGGTLILSGILQHQEKDLLHEYSKDFKLVSRLQKNDWVCLELEKN